MFTMSLCIALICTYALDVKTNTHNVQQSSGEPPPPTSPLSLSRVSLCKFKLKFNCKIHDWFPNPIQIGSITICIHWITNFKVIE